ncbi:acyl-CoA thioesterase [Paludibacterium purpuratum]|uniref:Acyl-CoA thioesterase YciA n=1 Tax=Paludibacterium purpuratum TaxID=1144873 RepID=A0A4R7AYK5_9NEIS|nr:acyl-CoA thioesterase [Paludibacterium purpuratum]TDR73021.1 acyl-CoA thioesterase YciA [Paludibacterium purpuratum]
MTSDSSPAPALCVQATQESLDDHGRVRAGWLLTQIDLAATRAGERLTQGPVAAVSVNAFQLQVPIYLGDMVTLYAECLRKGQHSLVLKMTAQAQRGDGSMVAVAEVIMTYVAVDFQGKSRQIG